MNIGGLVSALLPVFFVLALGYLAGKLIVEPVLMGWCEHTSAKSSPWRLPSCAG